MNILIVLLTYHRILSTVMKMKSSVTLGKVRFLILNTIFATTALILERVGISLNMYVYAEHVLSVFDVPLIIIAYWIIIGHTSWVIFENFGWIAGVLTGVVIDLPFEFLAFHLGWWTWSSHWSPIFFDAPVANFIVYFSVSLGSILTYKYVMKPKL